jgi:hypothetical protein
VIRGGLGSVGGGFSIGSEASRPSRDRSPARYVLAAPRCTGIPVDGGAVNGALARPIAVPTGRAGAAGAAAAGGTSGGGSRGGGTSGGGAHTEAGWCTPLPVDSGAGTAEGGSGQSGPAAGGGGGSKGAGST